MNRRADALVEELGLKAHPEGGFYREIFRSKQMVSREPDGPPRAALTTIFYLLASGQHSRWHCVASDEQWTFVEGDPIDLFTVSPDGSALSTTRLGPSSGGHDPVAVVPASFWQAARPTGAFALVSCSVAPGFAFEDFRFLASTPDAQSVVAPVLGDLKALL